MPRVKQALNDEKGRLIFAACVCGAMLIVAALVPLAFRTPLSAPETEEAAPEEKAALFSTYWYEGAEGLTVEKIDAPGEGMKRFCEERMATLAERCLPDRALSERTPTGYEYATVTDESGAALRLCRMWLQARGDWQNWLDVCFDADTGLVYYLYVSRECLTNLNLYIGGERPDAREIAERLAASFDGSVRYFLPDSDGNGTAVISAGTGTLCYEIRRVIYDMLVDIRINCV